MRNKWKSSRTIRINFVIVIFAVVVGIPLFLLAGRPWDHWASNAYLVVIIGGLIVSAIIGVIDQRRERRARQREEHHDVRS